MLGACESRHVYSESPDGALASKSPDMSGSGGGPGLLGSIPGPTEAHPLGPPQSLADWSEEHINTWGPISTVHDVVVEGQHYFVAELCSVNPFTPTYQLPSGTIVNSNRPLEELVLEDGSETLPPIITWASPTGPVKIFQGEIGVLFKPQASQAQIQQVIAQHNLEVIWSWFDPPVPPALGNKFAFFQFGYNQVEFPSFTQAWLHFNADPLVEEAIPASIGLYKPDYDDPENEGAIAPSDHYNFYKYDDPNTEEVEEIPRAEGQQIMRLGIASSPYVPLGPEDQDQGQWFSDQVIAVVDCGVWRMHPDFAFI